MKIKTGLGRTHLIVVSIIALILALALTAGGILMIVFGARFDSLVGLILMIVFGSLISLLGLALLCVAFVMLFTALAMIKTVGSVRDGNRAMVGTENATLCPNCGNVVDGDFCTNCGTSIAGKTCTCGHKNSHDAKFCTKCGKGL